MRRIREQRGQTASEYLGMLLCVAVIIGALVSLGPGGKIADGALDAVCRIAGGTCSGPGAGDEEMPEPLCVLALDTETYSAGVTVASVKVGAKGTAIIQERADGTFAVTINGELAGGVSIGAGANVSIDGGGAGTTSGGKAEGNGLIGANGSRTYVFKSRDEADRFVRGVRERVVRGAVTGGNPIGGFLADRIFGEPEELPTGELEATAGELNIQGDITFHGGGGGGGDLTLAGAPAAGARYLHKTGDTIIYMRPLDVSIDGELRAGPLAGNAKAGVQEQTSLVLDRSGKPKKLSVTLTVEAGAGLDLPNIKLANGESLSDALKRQFGETFNVKAKTGKGGRLVVQLDQNLDDPESREAAVEFINAASRRDVEGARAAAARIFESRKDKTLVTARGYSIGGDDVGADVSAAYGIKFGAEGGYEYERADLEGAWRWTPEGGFQESTSCKPR